MEEAIADYTAAYQLDNKRIDAICERGQVYQQGGNFELAIRDFEQCYKVKPDAPQAALQLAWILATCPDESLRDGARALTIAGDNCDLITCRRTEPLNALAAAYAELGDFQKAKQLQQRAVALSHFSPEFHETSTRRLNTITNHSPIREANIPLAVLPHFTSELTREITLEEVMSAPPDVVGLSYLEVSTILDFCPLSKLGATVNATLDGVYLQLTPFNTNRIEKLLKNRLTVYEEAMRKRGSSQLKVGYQPQLNGGCSEWGISDEPILVEQEGFKIHLTQGNVRHKGVVIESTVVFRHDANVGVLISGEIVGDNLVFVTPIYDSAGGDAAERCTATLVPHEIAGPSWSKAYVGRANAHYIFGNYPSLIADLERSVEMDANSQTWSYLAYRLATCPDKKVRDGKRALAAALTAQTLAQDKSELEVLVALAAAYAENRDFESAIKYQKQVIEKAGVDEKIFYEERLKLFEAKRPLRDKFGSAF
jgi:tetratricopeptide (TPR) repeat protein